MPVDKINQEMTHNRQWADMDLGETGESILPEKITHQEA
jgi:hypothetical protein